MTTNQEARGIIPHHSACMQDSRLQEVKAELGWAGIGVYWALMELIVAVGGILNPDQVENAYVLIDAPKNTVKRLLHDFDLCAYCYLKKGVFKRIWSTAPRLKACFQDEEDAITTFLVELGVNPELREKGLFFTFTSDPFLPETADLNTRAIRLALGFGVPVSVLTKRAEVVHYIETELRGCENLNKLSVGFTLTGADEQEPNASTNEERRNAMKQLHEKGFKTWASIEPIVDFQLAIEQIRLTRDYCDTYKIGLMDVDKPSWDVVDPFIALLIDTIPNTTPVYLKDSILRRTRAHRNSLPKNFVDRNFM